MCLVKGHGAAACHRPRHLGRRNVGAAAVATTSTRLPVVGSASWAAAAVGAAVVPQIGPAACRRPGTPGRRSWRGGGPQLTKMLADILVSDQHLSREFRTNVACGFGWGEWALPSPKTA